jgi:hypothetical protein
VGELESRPVGPRSVVWGEPAVVEAAAAEFIDTERFLAAGEALMGPYVWGRYDVLCLPPSFPFGGMENPCLTFVTPVRAHAAAAAAAAAPRRDWPCRVQHVAALRARACCSAPRADAARRRPLARGRYLP